MFIDTHCHLTDKYTDGIENVISRATDAGVGIMICPTADPNDIIDALKIANTYDNIFCTIGIHPEYAPMDATDFLTDDILQNPRVVGVGEIGLDYHYSPQSRNEQIKLFEQQLEIADKHALPVAIHTRDAEDDTIETLKNHPGAHGVMHCFTSDWKLAEFALSRGFYFSASGILTFKNSVDIRETFAKIPLDKIVIETDTPYCAPVPHRGKTCEPYMVVETARVLADIKNLQLDELETILMENVKKLYPKTQI